MRLSKLVSDFVSHKRSLGMRFKSGAQILDSFCRHQGDVELQDIDPARVAAFIAGRGPITTTWHSKHSALTGLYRFALARGYASSTPLPATIPKRPPPCPPYIYSIDELKRLIAATETFNRIRAGRMLLGPTLRTMLLLFYGTGLRRSEALSLTLADVELPARLLHIRDTKFFKHRLVPIGPRLAAELAAHLKGRHLLPCLDGEASPFFVTRRGKRIDSRCVDENFRKLCVLAGVKRETTAVFQPRLHDLRHTFAVHRLVAWYRGGADVQRLLPHLSTYLGHVNIAATQRYLSMTPDLLAAASQRFENYISKEVVHV